MTQLPDARPAVHAVRRLFSIAAGTAMLTSAVFAPSAHAGGTQLLVATAQISEVLGAATDPSCQASSAQPFPTASGTINGHGVGTVIGAFTVASVDCIRATDPFFNPPFQFNSTAFTLTTANGDTVVINYSGTASLSPVGLLVLQGGFTITGGTGAYRKAKGSGTLTGVEVMSATGGSGYVTLTGKMSH